MPRVLLVAQETGGVGKSTVTRGLAEAAGASGQTTEADAEIEAEDEAEALAT
ncbi:hypothetical protein [Citrobacter sp. VF227]